MRRQGEGRSALTSPFAPPCRSRRIVSMIEISRSALLFLEQADLDATGIGGPRTKSSGRSFLPASTRASEGSAFASRRGCWTGFRSDKIHHRRLQDEHALIQIKWREPARERKVNAPAVPRLDLDEPRRRSPPAMIFRDPYREDGSKRNDPVPACRDHLSPKREEEIQRREKDLGWKKRELR